LQKRIGTSIIRYRVRRLILAVVFYDNLYAEISACTGLFLPSDVVL
jgi:hypothetical protein